MKLILEMDMDNAAFQDNEPGDEAARILREVARKLQDGYTTIPMRDYNGNSVGVAKIVEDNPRGKRTKPKVLRIYEDEAYTLAFDFYGDSTGGLPFFPGEIYDVERDSVSAGRFGCYLKETLRELMKNDDVGDSIVVMDSHGNYIAQDWEDVRKLLKKRVLKGEAP